MLPFRLTIMPPLRQALQRKLTAAERQGDLRERQMDSGALCRGPGAGHGASCHCLTTLGGTSRTLCLSI